MTAPFRINPKKMKRYRPYSHEQLDGFYRQTTQGRFARSTRRIFFTFSEDSVENRGFYKADQLSGMGTGILYYYQQRYFLLTAYHVVSHTLAHKQNESPLFIRARDQIEGPMFDPEYLLFPRWHWDIRDLMPTSEGDTSWRDVALIELFDPLCAIPKDEILDLSQVQVVERQGFFEGQMLVASGYPEIRNSFEYLDHDELEVIQSTYINRHHWAGNIILGEGKNDFFVKPRHCGISHDELNGMSGGMLINLYPNLKKTKWAGMLKTVDEANDRVQFIPAYAILPALKRYAEARRYSLDPLAGAPHPNISLKQRDAIQQLMRHLASLR